MSSTDFMMLDEDDDKNDALHKLFATKLKSTAALGGYRRVLKANERHSGVQRGRSERVAMIGAKKRDWDALIAEVDRDIARGETPHASTMKQYESAKKKSAQATVEIREVRNAPQIAALPAETLAEYLLETHDNFVDATVEMKLPKGQSPLEALDSSRENLKELRFERAGVTNAPLPFEDAVAQLTRDVDAKAAAGAPNLRPVTKLQTPYVDYASPRVGIKPAVQGSTEWPTSGEYIDGRTVDLDQGSALVCWLFRDAIIERGKAELAKLYGETKGISIQERASLLAKIDAEILQEERREEEIVAAL